MNGEEGFRKIAFIVIVTVIYIHGVASENINDIQNLLDILFEGQKYNKLVRGVNDQSQTVNVNVSMKILSLLGLNDVEESLEMIGVLRIVWQDERLVWDPNDYNNTRSVHVFQNLVWKPEVIVANPAKPISLFGQDRNLINIYFNGTVCWIIGDVFKSYCPLDLTAFPWDRQNCNFQLLVAGYNPEEVTLLSTFDRIELRSYQDNGAWDLVSTRIVHTENPTISLLIISLELRRYSMFSVVNVFIPIMTLTVLNTLSFFIPHECGEKLSYCITVLLAFAVYLSTISDYLPTNSNKIASLCYFLLFKLMISAIICACTVLSLHLYHKNESKPPPQWLCRLVFRMSFRKVSRVRQVNDIVCVDLGTVTESRRKESTLRPYSHIYVTWRKVSQIIDHICFFVSLLGLFIASTIFAISVSTSDP